MESETKTTRCRKHPRYRGIYRHRTDCLTCDVIYWENHGQMKHPIPEFGPARTKKQSRTLLDRLLGRK